MLSTSFCFHKRADERREALFFDEFTGCDQVAVLNVNGARFQSQNLLQGRFDAAEAVFGENLPVLPQPVSAGRRQNRAARCFS